MAAVPHPVRSGPKLPKSLTASDDPSVAEFLTILDKHRQQCEDSGRYIEAEVAKKRIAELRGHEDQRRKEAVHARHIAEKLDIEEGHMVEFEAYNLAWDKKMQDFEEKAALLERELQEQHARKLLKWQEAQAQKTFKPKYSRDLMQLRATEKAFAKNMNYMEAQRIKLNADAREKYEFEEAKKEWLSKLFSKQSVVTKQFDNELEMCRQRIKLGREELRRTRQTELDRLLQRYQNMKTAVETQQNIEKVKLSDLNLGSGLLPAKNASAAVNAMFFTPPSTSITPSAPQHLSASLQSSAVSHRVLPVPVPSTGPAPSGNALAASALLGATASSTASGAGAGAAATQQLSATQPVGAGAAAGKGAGASAAAAGAGAGAGANGDWKTQTSPSKARQPVHSSATRTKAATNTGARSPQRQPQSARKPAAASPAAAGSLSARKPAPAVAAKRAPNTTGK